MPSSFRQRTPGDRLHKMAGAFGCRDIADMYTRFASHWTTPNDIVVGGAEPPTVLTRCEDRPAISNPADDVL
jgi:asparagine synthase (glutamine-hydrolysing)